MFISKLLWLLVPWSLAFLFLGRLRHCTAFTATTPATVTVSIIIPARNESQRLPPLLASLQQQDYPIHELIVADDHSTDNTALLAAGAGAQVITVPELPDDWLGKPFACWVGAQRATGDLLLFLDADTVLTPMGLRQLVATYQQHGGLVSVQPYHTMHRTYEQLSAFFFIIMMASIRSFTVFGQLVRANGCFGPCILCERSLYFRIGGHDLVRHDIIDDVALAQQFQQRGVSIHNFIGTGAVQFRMYPHGVRDLMDGWTKNLAQGALTTDLLLLTATTAWIAGSVATIDAVRGVVFGWSHWAIAGCIAYVAYTAQLWWLLKKLGNYGFMTAALYPVSLAFFVLVFARSLYRTLIRQQVAWKGRVITLKRPRVKLF